MHKSSSHSNREALYLCMGSGCHQRNVYDVLPKLQLLIKQYNLENCIELKGAFCLGPCAEGVVIKLREQLFTGISNENVEERFINEILLQLNNIVRVDFE